MRNFRDLDVWLRAHRLALDVYAAAKTFPKEELFGLTSQIRRAALSIPNNIAEGCGRRSQAEFAHFLQIAMGSASELEYLLLFSQDAGFLSDDLNHELMPEVQQIKRMLTTLILLIRRKLHGRADG